MRHLKAGAIPRASSLVHVHQGPNGNLKLFSGALLDNYRIAIDMTKSCTRLLLDLASPLFESDLRTKCSIGFTLLTSYPRGRLCLLPV
jgi:secreted Zn-dependent insulinase-like peptidase